jgi:hypothetical protein
MKRLLRTPHDSGVWQVSLSPNRLTKQCCCCKSHSNMFNINTRPPSIFPVQPRICYYYSREPRTEQDASDASDTNNSFNPSRCSTYGRVACAEVRWLCGFNSIDIQWTCHLGFVCCSVVATSLVYPCLDCDLGFSSAPILTYSKDVWWFSEGCTTWHVYLIISRLCDLLTQGALRSLHNLGCSSLLILTHPVLQTDPPQEAVMINATELQRKPRSWTHLNSSCGIMRAKWHSDGMWWWHMSDDEWRLSFCEVKSSLAAYPGLRKTPGLGCKTS